MFIGKNENHIKLRYSWAYIQVDILLPTKPLMIILNVCFKSQHIVRYTTVSLIHGKHMFLIIIRKIFPRFAK